MTWLSHCSRRAATGFELWNWRPDLPGFARETKSANLDRERGGYCQLTRARAARVRYVTALACAARGSYVAVRGPSIQGETPTHRARHLMGIARRTSRAIWGR